MKAQVQVYKELITYFVGNTSCLCYLFFVFIFFFQCSYLHAEEKSINDEDYKYVLDSLDLENGKINPGEPNTKFQELTGELLQAIVTLRLETQKSVNLIGPIQFESMSDLADPKNILILRTNLKLYKMIKEGYYEKADALKEIYRKKFREANFGKDNNPSTDYEKQTELSFLNDLEKYYDFMIKNHDSFVFQEEEMYGTDDNILNEYNALREKMVHSAAIMSAYEESKNKAKRMLQDRKDEVKEK